MHANTLYLAVLAIQEKALFGYVGDGADTHRAADAVENGAVRVAEGCGKTIERR